MSGSNGRPWLWIAGGAVVALVVATGVLLTVALVAAPRSIEESSVEVEFAATTTPTNAGSTDSGPSGGGQRLDTCGDYHVEDIGFGDLVPMLSTSRFGPPTELLLANDDELVTVTGAQPVSERRLFVSPDVLVDRRCEAEVVVVVLTVTSAVRTNELTTGDRVEVVLSPLGRRNLETILAGEAKVVLSLYRATTDGAEGLWGVRFEEFGVLAVDGVNVAAVETLKPRYASVADLRLVVDEGSVLESRAVPYSLDQPPVDSIVEGDIDVPGDLVVGELTPIVVSGLGGGTAWLVTCRQDAPDGASINETCDLATIQHELSYLGPTTLPYRPPASIQLSDGAFSCVDGPGCAVTVALTQNIGVRATGILDFAG